VIFCASFLCFFVALFRVHAASVLQLRRKYLSLEELINE
jgi:hypothetical protein